MKEAVKLHVVCVSSMYKSKLLADTYLGVTRRWWQISLSVRPTDITLNV